jgi:hypothetical protein
MCKYLASFSPKVTKNQFQPDFTIIPGYLSDGDKPTCNPGGMIPAYCLPVLLSVIRLSGDNRFRRPV